MAKKTKKAKTTKKAAAKKKTTKKSAAKKATKKTTKKAAKKATKKTAAKKSTGKKKTAKKATKKATAKKTTKKAAKKSKAKTTKKTKRQPNAAFMKPLTPSPELAQVVGSAPLPRTQVIQKLWVYIKKNKLQDENNRRMIIADEKLQPVFGKKTLSMFEMTKVVNQHLK